MGGENSSRLSPVVFSANLEVCVAQHLSSRFQVESRRPPAIRLLSMTSRGGFVHLFWPSFVSLSLLVSPSFFSTFVGGRKLDFGFLWVVKTGAWWISFQKNICDQKTTVELKFLLNHPIVVPTKEVQFSRNCSLLYRIEDAKVWSLGKVWPRTRPRTWTVEWANEKRDDHFGGSKGRWFAARHN